MDSVFREVIGACQLHNLLIHSFIIVLNSNQFLMEYQFNIVSKLLRG